ncbi:hypothetical protein D3C71_2170380 [compost metagenome]
MLENEIDPDGLLVVVLILIDRRVMAVRVCIRCHGVPDTDVAPTQALGELMMLLGKGN